MRAFLRNATVFLALLAPLTAHAQATDQPGEPSADLATVGPLGEQTLGSPDAPVTMIEYASLTCSHCGNFYRTTFSALKEKYIDTGKVHFILREFPLDALALAAAMTARCAPEKDYFAIIDALFVEQAKWAYVDKPAPALLEILGPYGFTEESFGACIKDQKVAEGIVEVARRGEALGVDGTPAFFINGEKYSGEMNIERIDTVLAPLLTASE